MSAATEQEIAFKSLFTREYLNLCRFALTYMQDMHLAEDVVQETFIKIWDQKKDLITSPNIRFYLATAVKNNCISALRKAKAENTVLSGDMIIETEPEPFFSFINYREQQDEQQQKITKALDRLPPKCKEVFLLVKQQGMSYKQTAEALGLSIKTIENQMGKALKILKESSLVSFMGISLFFLKDLLIHVGVLIVNSVLNS